MRQLHLLVLLGSTKDHSSNQKLVKFLEKAAPVIQADHTHDRRPPLWEVFPIGGLPYFDPDLDKEIPAQNSDQLPGDQIMQSSKLPTVVQQLRAKAADADGILICTPEYVFSLPGILKNALEWLVGSTCLADKPMALITAAASGQKAKESLELIVSTLGGKFSADSSIRIQGVAGKFNKEGELCDDATIQLLKNLMASWLTMIYQQKTLHISQSNRP